jgi:predicted metalloenzyme YecM
LEECEEGSTSIKEVARLVADFATFTSNSHQLFHKLAETNPTDDRIKHLEVKCKANKQTKNYKYYFQLLE